MITFEKVGSTHFNVMRDSQIIFSGSLDAFLLVPGGFNNKSVIIKSVDTNEKLEIKLSDTEEANMLNLIYYLGDTIFSDFVDPVLDGSEFIYDASSCYVATDSSKTKVGLIAVKGALEIRKKIAFGKVTISFLKDNSEVVHSATFDYLESIALFDDEAKALTYEVSSGAATEATVYSETQLAPIALQSMGTSPIEVLPGLVDPNQYYDIEKVIVECNAGAQAYVFTGRIALKWTSTGISTVIPDFMNDNGVWITKTFFNQFGATALNTGEVSELFTSDSLSLTTDDSSNSTGFGDGTLNVKVWYVIRTKGVQP